MSRDSRLPKYRRHATGQAFVQVDGHHCLGKYGDPRRREAYGRFIAELAASPGPAFWSTPRHPRTTLTVVKLATAYLDHAEAYYVKTHADFVQITRQTRPWHDPYPTPTEAKHLTMPLQNCITASHSSPWPRLLKYTVTSPSELTFTGETPQR